MIKELIVKNNPKSAISESIKTIRTNLLFSNVDKNLKTILVTSTQSGEGKSFVAANLAIAFSQINKKVLIVDSDLRKGRQHKIFRISNKEGLSNLLLEPTLKTKYKKYLKETTIENVFILPMGIVPPNPSELLDSDKNKQLIDILKENFDIVIFDGTPANGLSDSLIMSKLVDEVVIVSAIKETHIETLEKAKDNIEKVGGHIAGIIINKTPRIFNKYYKEYKY